MQILKNWVGGGDEFFKNTGRGYQKGRGERKLKTCSDNGIFSFSFTYY